MMVGCPGLARYGKPLVEHRILEMVTLTSSVDDGM